MSFQFRVACLAALLSLTTIGFGWAQRVVEPPKPAEQTYILGPSDVVEVSVLTHPDYTTKGRIGEDGTIQLPYLGTVKAANMTSAQLEAKVAEALDKGGYFTHPVVKVDIVSFGSRYVTVLGAVGTPGLVPVDRPYRLSEILARVGGVKDNGADYVVLTPANGTEEKLAIKDIATGGLKEDPYVQPGDKIYSPPAELFYVSGQVNAPGAYAVIPGMTLRMAIARAGGVNISGSEKKVKLMRHGVRVAHVDLNEPVQPGDVLTIGMTLFAF
ncbi:MAG: polysaccharide biosynthesis/export family protein [Caulobacteraceae bacterium]